MPVLICAVYCAACHVPSNRFQRSVIEAQANAAASITLNKAHTEAIKKFTSVGVPPDEASLMYLTMK